MDKQTKVEIKVVVRDAIREAMECYQERWVTDKEMGRTARASGTRHLTSTLCTASRL